MLYSSNQSVYYQTKPVFGSIPADFFVERNFLNVKFTAHESIETGQSARSVNRENVWLKCRSEQLLTAHRWMSNYLNFFVPRRSISEKPEI